MPPHGGEPLPIFPSYSFFLPLPTAAQEQATAASIDDAFAGPFAGARVPLAGERATVEWSGYGALFRWSGEWRLAVKAASLSFPSLNWFNTEFIRLILGLGFDFQFLCLLI
jgi:hypothetical protein